MFYHKQSVNASITILILFASQSQQHMPYGDFGSQFELISGHWSDSDRPHNMIVIDSISNI